MLLFFLSPILFFNLVLMQHLASYCSPGCIWLNVRNGYFWNAMMMLAMQCLQGDVGVSNAKFAMWSWFLWRVVDVCNTMLMFVMQSSLCDGDVCNMIMIFCKRFRLTLDLRHRGFVCPNNCKLLLSNRVYYFLAFLSATFRR